ncbi:DUF4276 family protein [Candidatus Magnetomonas plexicatena]|uniref:DUF4276 family protein n=1 Tax=Candidatus Magnetomonas plexicatena TaxID=2552947 RepID=UPI001C77FCF7|nr:DUF4276 family protein [Nitrospirales bacterium LBB_01]
MKKIYFFVEGQTEAIFVEQFLLAYMGYHNLKLERHKYISQYMSEKVIMRENPNAKYEVRIYDVGGDSNVTSKIKEKAESLIKDNGYDYIVGLHDLYRVKIDGEKIKKEEKKKIIEAFKKLFKNKDSYDKIKYVLAIMETEAWFLMDYKMFCKIDGALIPSFIKNELGYDLINDNPESYGHPTNIIDKIYHLCGKKYGKHEDDSYKIAYNLDYTDLCCNNEYRNKVSSWNYFLDCIDLVFE